MKKHPEFDLSKIKSYPISGRQNKVTHKDFATIGNGAGFADFWKSLPSILAADDLRYLVGAMAVARKKKKPVIWLMGAHVIKVGLSPVIIELMRMGYVTAIGFNGAGSIHDSEVAMAGATSEDVAAGIKRGDFGMSRETAALLNGAINESVPEGFGLGGGIGRALAENRVPKGVKLKHVDKSLLAAAYRLGIPATVHIAVGTDIVHVHPSFDAALAGEGSHRDFKIMAHQVSLAGGGGVILNVGSSVILPLIVEKSLAAARNIGIDVENFTGANLDFIRHYRPGLNPVKRADELGGRGINITGHHEINIPLIYWALKTGAADGAGRGSVAKKKPAPRGK